ncbi:hypothetical protein ACHAW5_007791 [Stephanodiscus triporus]|uniref:SGNH hydrolase-type esterase domain-containing protein n=1 Tax=Stephanodiscus triporus TaxID=2934178 RepID=A0ABD3PF02_9STRA
MPAPKNDDEHEDEREAAVGSDGRPGGGISVAFLGNSILYYNDCPRFLVNLGSGSITRQDSCLRGGASLPSLWEDGNGMGRKFATRNAIVDVGDDTTAGGDVAYDVGKPTVLALLSGRDDDDDDAVEVADGAGDVADGAGDVGKEKRRWDFVVLNDHTQGPARIESRNATRDALLRWYVPLFSRYRATPVIVETAAYRYPGIRGSEDLGSNPREFQERVREGVASYVETLRSGLPVRDGSIAAPRMAPVGTAYLRVHDDDRELWEGLFDPYDNFHPSPSGTFLQGCVLHWTIFGYAPPLPRTEEEIAHLWGDARVMHDVRNGEIGPPLPSLKSAEYLWNVAREICSPTEGRIQNGAKPSNESRGKLKPSGT